MVKGHVSPVKLFTASADVTMAAIKTSLLLIATVVYANDTR